MMKIGIHNNMLCVNKSNNKAKKITDIQAIHNNIIIIATVAIN